MKKFFLSPMLLVFCLFFFACPDPEDENTDEAPVSQFSCFNEAVNAGEILILEDESFKNPTSWEWTISPEYYSFENGTDRFDQNPEISFTHAGFYTVS